PLGVGAWSSVHLAIPAEDCRSIPAPAAADTPPATPVGRSTQEFSKLTVAVWAIKAPINKTALTVIRSEARILSRIFSHQPQLAAHYVVPFHGLDPQTGNLVMDALPLTLDDFINEDLSKLPEPRRTALLANILPSLAQHLLSGLDWLHTAAGVVHADVKPSNVLLRPTRPGQQQQAAQQDASSNSTPNITAALPTPSPYAAGTWDFLAPELCRATAPPPIPTPASDVYALGITFLFLITGASPYDAVAQGNTIRRREMIRAGDAVGFAGMDGKGGARLRGVGREMEARGNGDEKGFVAWLRAGSAKSVERRVGAREW
ncbi:kinase-like domain-containing protein, partial [Phyllosticta citricarpa]